MRLLRGVLNCLVVSCVGVVLEGRFILPPAAAGVVHTPRERAGARRLAWGAQPMLRRQRCWRVQEGQFEKRVGHATVSCGNTSARSVRCSALFVCSNVRARDAGERDATFDGRADKEDPEEKS